MSLSWKKLLLTKKARISHRVTFFEKEHQPENFISLFYFYVIYHPWLFQTVHGKTSYEWHTSTEEWHTGDMRVHTSDIRMTYESIRVTYGWHASTYEWHTDDIPYTGYTAWKVSKYEVISAPYFPAFGLNTEYLLATFSVIFLIWSVADKLFCIPQWKYR